MLIAWVSRFSCTSRASSSFYTNDYKVTCPPTPVFILVLLGIRPCQHQRREDASVVCMYTNFLLLPHRALVGCGGQGLMARKARKPTDNVQEKKEKKEPVGYDHIPSITSHCTRPHNLNTLRPFAFPQNNIGRAGALFLAPLRIISS